MFNSHKNSVSGLCVRDVIKSRAWVYIMPRAQSRLFLSGSTHLYLKELKSEAKKYFCGINIDGTTVQGLEVFAHWLCFQIGCLHTDYVFRLAVCTVTMFSVFSDWVIAQWPCFQTSCLHTGHVFILAVCTLFLDGLFAHWLFSNQLFAHRLFSDRLASLLGVPLNPQCCTMLLRLPP